MRRILLNSLYYLLQFVEEPGSMRPIELGVVELEGNGKGGFEPMALVTSPNQEGIVEDAAVLIDDAVQLRAHHCRCSNNHRFLVGNVLACSACRLG